MTLPLAWSPPKPVSSEVELGRTVREKLVAVGWALYQEVELHSGGRRADLVAVKNETVWVIEIKQRMSLRLMDQVLAWRHFANLLSMATLYRHGSGAVRAFCDATGIGWLQAMKRDGRVEETISARLDPAANSAHLLEVLHQEHQTFAEAGNDTGRYFTAYQATCDRLRAVVALDPGISLRDAVDRLNHHYVSKQSARSALRKWLRLGKIEGISHRVERGRMLLFRTEAK